MFPSQNHLEANEICQRLARAERLRHLRTLRINAGKMDPRILRDLIHSPVLEKLEFLELSTAKGLESRAALRKKHP